MGIGESFQTASIFSELPVRENAEIAALAADPDLLSLDEPYGGLAPQTVEDVESAIERVDDQGVTILPVEQNAAAAIYIADRAYVVDRLPVDGRGTP